jgi:hypothetical protein
MFSFSSHLDREHPSPNLKVSSFGMKLVEAVCVLLCVSIASAQARHEPKAALTQVRPIHIVRKVDTLRPQIKEQAPQGIPHLDYYGGPVVSNVRVVVVFWGPNVDSTVTSQIGNFYQDIVKSTYFDLVSEYSTTIAPVGGGTGTNQSIGRGSYGGAFTIVPSVCNTNSCTLTDAEIQAEILSQVGAGNLPAPSLDSSGNVDTLYMTYFPPGVSITQGGTGSCVSGGFCAYHGTTSNTFNSRNLLYGVVPDFGPGSGCDVGCGASPAEFQNITSVSSHELVETVTDADVGLAQYLAPPLAWYDSVNGEIGDICNAEQAQVPAGATTYTIQKQWSNLSEACVSIGAHPAFHLTAPGTTAGSFNFIVTAQNPVGATTDTSFIGTVHFTSSDSQAVLPADYTFTSSDQGTQSFGATLKTGGPQTITATDTVNVAITGSAPVSVSSLGSLTFTPSSISFGSHVAGITSIPRKVTLTNNAGGTVNIASITFGGANASDFAKSATTCGPTLAATKSCTISVTFTGGAVGPRSGSLLITDNASNSPQTVILSGTVTPQVTLYPPTVTFLKTKVGTNSLAKTVTLRNNLPRTLNISAVTFAGADPGDFVQSSTSCGTTLASGGTCSISIKFSPLAIGSRTAVLIVSDDATPNSLSTNLSGTGK